MRDRDVPGGVGDGNSEQTLEHAFERQPVMGSPDKAWVGIRDRGYCFLLCSTKSC